MGVLLDSGSKHPEANTVAIKELDKDWFDPAKFEFPATPVTVELADGAGPGLSPTHGNSDQKAAFWHPSPVFDLDDAAHQHGRIEVDVRLTMVSAGTQTMGFREHATTTANTARKVFGSGGASVGLLRDLATYVAGDAIADIKGDEIFSQDVFYGADLLGRVKMFLARNAENELGLVLAYDGERAANDSNMTLQTRVTVSFNPYRVRE